MEIRIIGKLDAKRHSTTNIYDTEGELGTTMARDHHEHKKIAIDIIGTLDPKRHSQMDIMGDGISQTLDTLDEKKKVAIPVLTPDRGVKKQNGKRTREDGEPSYTLTAQEPQGVAVDVTGTAPQDGHPPVYVDLPNGHKAYCIWYPKKQCYITIRRLTPKEYFRLQGWTDDYFEKAQFVNSDSQLYKQAGNGVSLPVVEAIGKKLKEIEEEE